MPTTTIRLSEDLKARIAETAERAGMTAHAFIVDAIADRVSNEERRDEFYRIAEKRYAEAVVSGKTIPWTEMQTYLERYFIDEQPDRPKVRKLVR